MEICGPVRNLLPLITALRRELHQMPEPSLYEERTGAFVFDFLKSTGLKPHKIETGVYADIKGGDSSRLIALRCDIDALPITEKADVPYKSTNNYMHACGHDGHTAILLGLSKLFKEEKPPFNLRLIFQFGEEGAGGASKMCEAGVMEKVGEIYALHIDPALDKGKLATCHGAMFAGCVEFNINISGKAAHCAEPEKGRDAAAALIGFLTKSGTFNEKHKNNTLFHTGKFSAGPARNIVADSARAECTLRFFDENAREEIMMNISRALIETDNLYGTSHTLTVEGLYDPLFNNPAAVKKARAVWSGMEECAPRFTAEDFSAFLQKAPGCMVWLGTRDEKFSSPLHSDTFGFDEEALLYGAEYFYRIVRQNGLA